jgi:acyl-CoA synthetase (AMP-forming)/AMP-acid ligase II
MADEPQTLRDLLLLRARVDGDRLAYDDTSQRLTYGELADRAGARAAHFARLGVRPRDRVALVLPSGVPFTEAFWALQLLGATPSAFNPHVPAETLERRVARLTPKLVVTDDLLAGSPAAASVPADPGVTPDDLAFLQQTSGTSGEPRAAMIRQRNVFACLAGGGDGRIAREDVSVAWIPPWHDMGLVRFVIGAVYHGAPCHFVRPAVSTIPLWLETISRVRATDTAAPDFAYRLATRIVDPAAVDLSSLRYAANGGEPIRASTIETFERRFGLSRVVQPGYGLAEATLGVAGPRPGDPLVVDASGNVSCGEIVDGLEVRIDGDDGAPGEILVRGGTVFAGYLDAPEETAEALRDGWLHTGDVGYLDADGGLVVLGRRRAMIKRGGGVVAPRELEEAAQEVDGVRLAAAVGVPGEGEASETVVVVVEALPTADAEALAGAVSRAIAASAGFAPGRVVVAAPQTIPRTLNGKIRHDRLRDQVREGVTGPAAA